MRDIAVFGRGRGWLPEDDEYRRLHLGPRRGAKVGEYATEEPGEYSDSYYGPGDAYPWRDVPSEGYMREPYGPRWNFNPPVGGVVGARPEPLHSPNYIGYGQLHGQERSWADLGVSTVRPGESGVTEQARPSFRGRGPRGYVRSDERLKELICERLTEDPLVDASDISVEVSNGEVTLTGTVENRMMKWRAEDLAEVSTNGALVHNRLRVRRKS